MSVRTGFAIVGAAIGAYFGNASLGYAIGSFVGGAVDPLRNFGPRLDDAKSQTAQPGAPIARVWGSGRIAGNIIACGPLKQHKHTDDGKSGQESITYTYTRTYAIGVCAGPIFAIRRVWRDGKLVLDETPDRDEKTRVANRQFRNKLRVYLGDEEQLPDSELEAILGANEVPAFRGLAYVVVIDDDLTDRAGSVPTYQFEVVSKGSRSVTSELKPMLLKNNSNWVFSPESTSDPRLPGNVYRYRFYADGVLGAWKDTAMGAMQDYSAWSGRSVEVADEPVGWGQRHIQEGGITPGWEVGRPLAPFENPGAAPWIVSLVFARSQNGSGEEDQLVTYLDTADEYSNGKWSRQINYLYSEGASTGTLYGSGVVIDGRLRTDYDRRVDMNADPYIDPNIVVLGDAWVDVQAVPWCLEGTPESDWVLVPGTTDVYVDRFGHLHDLSPCTPTTGSFKQLALHADGQAPLGPILEVGDPDDTQIFWENAYSLAVAAGSIPSGLSYGSGYPKSSSEACFCQIDAETISDGEYLYVIVRDLLHTVGIPDEQMDVSQLTDVVDGFVCASQTDCADAIAALFPAYAFDGASWDAKLNFVKRGLPTVDAVIDTESVDDEDGHKVVEVRAQEVTVPRKLILTYQDQGANYAPVTQTAERYRVTVAAVGEANLSSPVVMDTDKAAQVADILLKDLWSSIRGTISQSLADEYSYLTPTDVIFVTSDEAVFRVRLTQCQVGAGALAYESIQDLANAYISNATGVPPIPPVDEPSGILGPTLAYYLNIPALRDKDDQPGFYIAAAGFFDGWRGALVEGSTDGGLTWTGSVQIRQESSLGVTVTDLSAWTPLVPDEEHTVEVVMTSGQLSSTDQAGLDAGLNAAWLDGEVLQFRTAELVEENTYRLSGLVRGRKYTPHGAHVAGSGFALLDSVYFFPVNRSQIGSTFTMRATTSGASTADGDVRTIILTRDWSVTEWPVTNVRAYRDDDHAAHIEWSPRHRLGNAAAPYASLWFTGYQITVNNGGTSRVYSTTAQTFVYTDAMATADFGSTGPFTFSIAATNSITGPSDPTEVVL